MVEELQMISIENYLENTVICGTVSTCLRLSSHSPLLKLQISNIRSQTH